MAALPLLVRFAMQAGFLFKSIRKVKLNSFTEAMPLQKSTL